MVTRRQFLTAAVATGLSTCGSRLFANPSASTRKIALLGTVLYRHSHTQHFVDRFAAGYTWNGTWQTPRVQLASVYIDQFPQENDLGRQRIAKYKLNQAASVKEALTLGGKELAVDGVVIIAEHGDYPRNELGQVRYPRYDWFKEIVKVFEDSGRSVPVFNDKHLSTIWAECREMVSDSRRLNFPFLAGSSLPVTRRLPAIDLPFGSNLTESVCVAYGGMDSYDFHAYETAQCMSERRHGGEVGIRSVQTLKGDALWSTLASSERKITRELVVAALTRSHNLPVDSGYPTDPVTFEWARTALADSTGIFIQHRDGFRTTCLMAPIRDFNYAGYLADKQEIVSCQMYLPMPGHGSTTADFFNPLVRQVEEMVLTGRTAYPLERTLLTSGMVIAGVQSLHRGGAVIETPEMDVQYTGPAASLFWQT